jgi:hypothetical protein
VKLGTSCLTSHYPAFFKVQAQSLVVIMLRRLKAADHSFAKASFRLRSLGACLMLGSQAWSSGGFGGACVRSLCGGSRSGRGPARSHLLALEICRFQTLILTRTYLLIKSKS